MAQKYGGSPCPRTRAALDCYWERLDEARQAMDADGLSFSSEMALLVEAWLLARSSARGEGAPIFELERVSEVGEGPAGRIYQLMTDSPKTTKPLGKARRMNHRPGSPGDTLTPEQAEKFLEQTRTPQKVSSGDGFELMDGPAPMVPTRGRVRGPSNEELEALSDPRWFRIKSGTCKLASLRQRLAKVNKKRGAAGLPKLLSWEESPDGDIIIKPAPAG